MNQEIVYIGCYTPEANPAIKVIQFDNQSGQLTELNNVSDLPDTSFLNVSKDKKYLLAVNEDGSDGELGCFDISQPTTPVFINKQSTAGGSPCHISLTAKKAFVSNYVSGNVSAFSLSESQLLPAYTTVQHDGNGPNKERQESPHAHASQVSVNEQFLVVADLGIDALKVYAIADEQLTLVFSVSLPGGSGPRHMSFNHNGDKLYLGNELNNTVTMFQFNQSNGALSALQTISSLPITDDILQSSIAEVALSNDGRYLYVSNRGHDSIAVFTVNPQTGMLTNIDFTKTGGLFPRHFALSPNQNWLLVAHQNSDYLQVFKRNIETGLLTQSTQKLAVKHAVCVCFL